MSETCVTFCEINEDLCQVAKPLRTGTTSKAFLTIVSMASRCNTCRRFQRQGEPCRPCTLSRVPTPQCPTCGIFCAPEATCLRCLPCCRNCHRHRPDGNVPIGGIYGIDIRAYIIQSVGINPRSTRKFSFIRGTIQPGETTIELCLQCKTYLSRPVNNADTEHTWPAFIWSILRSPRLFEQTWLLLPTEWKSWWIYSLHTLHGSDLAQLASATSMFVDVSIDSKRDSASIDALIWRGLMDREESLVLPTVKCPAGCSEYKHKCNELPLDVVFRELLHEPLPLLMTNPKKSSSFTRIFRPDYLLPHRIAYNPRWLCQASVAKTKRGAPVVLCCRHHSESSVHQMVHPPRNPTGPLSSSFSGGLSTVVPVPRTIKKAKISNYAASYHMAHLEGSYTGLDTLYLSSNNQVRSTGSQIGWKQDVVTYANRSDVRACINKTYKGHVQNGSIAVALERCAPIKFRL